MTLRRVSTIAALGVSALVLAGCAAEPAGPSAPTPGDSSTTSPSPAPEPSETPAADPLAAVDGIQLNAETVDLRDGAERIRSLRLSDMSDTLAALTGVLGEPTVTVTEADPNQVCTIPNTRYAWKDALILVTWTSGDPAGYDVRLLGDHLQRADGDDEEVALTATGGVSVGDDIGELVARTSPDLIDTWSYEGVTHHTVILQQGYRDRTDTTGLAAFTDEGVVAAIGTPVPVHSNADC